MSAPIQHTHRPAEPCALDCPGRRLTCGDTLDERRPECRGWGGIPVDEAIALAKAIHAMYAEGGA